jgi:hypothetical protein
MKNHILLAVILLAALTACKDKATTENSRSYKADMEQNSFWSNTVTIVNQPGHSGNYCSLVDSTNTYSVTFHITLKEIGLPVPKKIKFAGWCKAEKLPCDASLVCSIEKEGQNLVYTGLSFKDFITKPNEWGQLKGEIQVPPNLTGDSQIKVYVWSTKGQKVWADDLEISME